MPDKAINHYALRRSDGAGSSARFIVQPKGYLSLSFHAHHLLTKVDSQPLLLFGSVMAAGQTSFDL